MNEDVLDRIRHIIGDEKPIVVSVHAEEAISINEIPQALAICIAGRLGLSFDTEIIQTAKVSRTGADGFHRLANPPPFAGTFPQGASAIIVDDTLTQGGTFASLRGLIEREGGRVLLATALTGKQYSSTLAIEHETLRQLRQLYEPLETWWQQEFGYGFDSFTESEARYLIKSRQDADTIRTRVLAARQAPGE